MISHSTHVIVDTRQSQDVYTAKYRHFLWSNPHWTRTKWAGFAYGWVKILSELLEVCQCFAEVYVDMLTVEQDAQYRLCCTCIVDHLPAPAAEVLSTLITHQQQQQQWQCSWHKERTYHIHPHLVLVHRVHGSHQCKTLTTQAFAIYNQTNITLYLCFRFQLRFNFLF